MAVWEPTNLRRVLDGDTPTPTLCVRSDGNGILYEGLLHVVRGSSQSGKTILAAVAAAQVLREGRQVIWVDMVHTAAQMVSTLRTLGVTDQQILAGVTYYSPYTWDWGSVGDATLVVVDAHDPVPATVLDAAERHPAAWLITGHADDWMRTADNEVTARADVHIHCVLHTVGGRRCRYRLLKDRYQAIRVPKGDQPPLADLWIHPGSYQLTPGRETPHEAGSKLEQLALEILRKQPGVDHDNLIGLLGQVAKRDRERLVARLANEGRIVSRLDDGRRIWFVADKQVAG